MFSILFYLFFAGVTVYATEAEQDITEASVNEEINEEALQNINVQRDSSEEDQLIRKILEGTDNIGESQLSTNESENIIRVAWYEREGYFEEDINGNLSGFGMEYLDAISEYTGWEYEFLYGTREQCIYYLENGLADIMAPVGVAEEFSNVKIVREVIGEDYGYIYKSANNYYLNFEDTSAFHKVILGVERESGLLDNLKRYCDEKNIKFYNIVTYETLDDMRLDLSEGKIDAFVTDSYVKLDNLKVIGQFSNNRVTFATAQDYVYDQLNYALEHIKLENPNFSNELKEKYFGEGSQNMLEYTEEERKFLNVRHNYVVVLSKEQYPISYISNGTMEYQGIGKEVLEKIETQTGVEFKVVYVDTYEEAKSLHNNREADLLCGVVVDSQNIKSLNSENKRNASNIRYTNAFYEIDLAFVGRKNTNFDEPLLVAVPAYMEVALPGLQDMYNSYNCVIYESDNACFDAILNKDVDVAIQSDLKINELIIYDKYKSLQNLKYVPGSYASTFCVNAEDEIIVAIVNKAIKSISSASMATIENNNIQHIAMQNMSVKDFLKVYKWQITAVMIVIIILIVAVSLYMRYKREEADKEKAYRDSIANISSMEKFRIDVEPIVKGSYKKGYYIIVIDIDKFKVINTLFGYEKGDQVIAFVAKILQSNLKVCDFVTRSNADNFIVLKHGENETEVANYLKTVFREINTAIYEHHNNYRMMLKAGIYPIDETDNNISNIIDKAGMAKKTIGQIHQSTYAFYSDVMRQRAIEEKTLENEMEDALEENQFCIYLQPQIDLATKKIVSAEALVRWIHPERGMIPPFKFIPIFENNGFISKLDTFVWEEAARTLKKWKENNQIMVPIAINLSRVDVEQDDVVERLTGLSEKYNLGTQWIKMELTESMYTEQGSLVMKRMTDIQNYGFKVAVDDFGSGYSSLHMLKKMPIDILKIDKSFLDEDMDTKDEVVIRDVISMGKHLNLQIIVEGVETKEQSDFLESIGCDIVQGYYYGRPMPVAEFENVLKENHEGGK